MYNRIPIEDICHNLNQDMANLQYLSIETITYNRILLDCFQTLHTTLNSIAEFEPLYSDRKETDFINHIEVKYDESFRITVLEEKYGGEPENCAICLESLDMGCNLDCGHFFHKNCLEEWGKYNKSCPVCRKSIKFSSKSKGEQCKYVYKRGKYKGEQCKTIPRNGEFCGKHKNRKRN